MIIEHLEALDFSHRRLGLIALPLGATSMVGLLAAGAGNYNSGGLTGATLYVGRACVLGYIASNFLSITGLFVDKRQGVAGISFALSIIFILMLSFSY